MAIPAAPAPVADGAKVDARPAAPQPVEGTKLLFLRLNLRIKLIEQNFVDLTPEQLNEHLMVAASLIDQLRARPLVDDEAARTERATQYLQNMVDTYVQMYRG